ncbi:unnamed protein product [Sphenostylis stenocarpa]|nr:unnamed protein product [Sphenostylis stenocarpa]CAK7337367.1 unnamed protein product [Dovyalis caffra]CAK7338576.1 unnamed protein product [Dovyalis caffra]
MAQVAIFKEIFDQVRKDLDCEFIGNNTMKKMLLATALALLITGCAQQTFTVQNKPAAVAPKETITHHFFVSGIGQKKTVDAAKICGGAENVVKTETQQTFVNGLLGFITLGIYTPLEARVYCSQ